MKIILGALLIFGAAWLMVRLQGSGENDGFTRQGPDHGEGSCRELYTPDNPRGNGDTGTDDHSKGTVDNS